MTSRKHRTTSASAVVSALAVLASAGIYTSPPSHCLCEAFSRNNARAHANVKTLRSTVTTSSTSLSAKNACDGDEGSSNAVDRRLFLSSSISIAIASQVSTPFSASAASEKMPASLVGGRAPDFSLPNTRGELVSLESLVAASAESGPKWTVLYFYPGAFTSGCTLEARKFQEDMESYRQLNTRVVGVSVDDLEKNSEFCKSEGLDFSLLSDVGGKVSKAYGSAISIPGFGTFSNRQTFIIDPEGKLRWVFIDVDSHIPRHSSEVLEKLKEFNA